MFRHYRVLAALLIPISFASCEARSPIQVGCVGATRGDWHTPIHVHVENRASQQVVAFKIAVYDVDQYGQQMSGFSPLQLQASIEPGAHADLKYPNNPTLYVDNKVTLPPRFRKTVRGIGCDTLEVRFADGSTWQKQGPAT